MILRSENDILQNIELDQSLQQFAINKAREKTVIIQKKYIY